ncbi:MAG: DUF397 domain-containing protein [Pseudonocardiaceae bacterium]
MSTPDRNSVVWRTSSYTASTGNCVEVAPTTAGGTVLVRDTKDREGPVLAVPAAVWRALLADIPR